MGHHVRMNKFCISYFHKTEPPYHDFLMFTSSFILCRYSTLTRLSYIMQFVFSANQEPIIFHSHS